MSFDYQSIVHQVQQVNKYNITQVESIVDHLLKTLKHSIDTLKHINSTITLSSSVSTQSTPTSLFESSHSDLSTHGWSISPLLIIMSFFLIGLILYSNQSNRSYKTYSNYFIYRLFLPLLSIPFLLPILAGRFVWNLFLCCCCMLSFKDSLNDCSYLFEKDDNQGNLLFYIGSKPFQLGEYIPINGDVDSF